MLVFVFLNPPEAPFETDVCAPKEDYIQRGTKSKETSPAYILSENKTV